MWWLIDHCMHAHAHQSMIIMDQLLIINCSMRPFQLKCLIFCSPSGTCWFVEKSLSFPKFLHFYHPVVSVIFVILLISHAATCSVLHILFFFFHFQISNNEFKNKMTDTSDWFDESSNEGTAWPIGNQIFDNNVNSQIICLFGVRCTPSNRHPIFNLPFFSSEINIHRFSIFKLLIAHFGICFTSFFVFECFV